MTDESGWTFLDPKQYDVPLLAQAWMALVPPKPGMVVRTSWGKRAVIGPHQDVVAGSWYVDLDSPANWGHWFAWLRRQIDESPSLVGLQGIPVNTKAPRTMMLRYVEWRMGWAEPGLPPSVLAWWKEHGQ